MEEKTFECQICNHKTNASSAPNCCGEPMQICTIAPSAEHSRPMEEEEPCDDSRSG